MRRRGAAHARPSAAGAGGLLLAANLEPLGASRADLVLPVFRFAFVCTLVAAWTCRVTGSVRRALNVAIVTAVTYLVLAVALDPLPGFHVGGGHRAMPKVALLCTLCAGMTGGARAYRILTSTVHPQHAQRKAA